MNDAKFTIGFILYIALCFVLVRGQDAGIMGWIMGFIAGFAVANHKT